MRYLFWHFGFAPPGVPEVPGPGRHPGRDPGSFAHHNDAAAHGVDDHGSGGAGGVEGLALGGSAKFFGGFLRWVYPHKSSKIR